jgi:hypothetical protein
VHNKQVLLFVRKPETVPKCTQSPQARNIHGTAIIRRTTNYPLVSGDKTELSRYSAPVPVEVLGTNNHLSSSTYRSGHKLCSPYSQRALEGLLNCCLVSQKRKLSNTKTAATSLYRERFERFSRRWL